MRILAVGGGSGGHVTPVAAVINELQKLQPNIEVMFVCDRAFYDQSVTVMEGAGISLEISVIPAGKFRRYAHFRLIDYVLTPSVLFKNLVDVGKTIRGVVRSIIILRRFKPEVVFAKGGYVCLPMGLAAKLLKIPLVIHDSDSRPGLTNRILSRFAVQIGTGFPTENYHYNDAKTTYVGVPIQSRFRAVTPERQAAAKQKLGHKITQPLIVGIGGGLGARSINSGFITGAPKLLSEGLCIQLLTGLLHIDTVRESTEQYAPFFSAAAFQSGDELLTTLIAADIVVTRASATTVQELAGLKKPIIAVPSRALGDQIKNAAFLEKKNAAVVLSDDDLEKGQLAPKVITLLNDKKKQDQLKTNLHALARPYAARDMAQMIDNLLK